MHKSKRLTINDHTMDCCAIVEAHGFNLLGNYGQEPSHEAAQKGLDELIKWQLDHRRNVALVALSDMQRTAIEVVLENGFKKILEVYNPNSGRNVHLYARVVWEDSLAYHEALESREYILPPLYAWRYANSQQPTEPVENKVVEEQNAL